MSSKVLRFFLFFLSNSKIKKKRKRINNSNLVLNTYTFQKFSRFIEFLQLEETFPLLSTPNRRLRSTGSVPDFPQSGT